MVINEESLAAVFTGLKASWAQSLQAYDSTAMLRLMTEVDSQTAAEDYPVAVLLGDMAEVIDEVTITNIGVWLQHVPNRDFARIVEVPRNSIQDDTLGIYKVAAGNLARRAQGYPMRLAVAEFGNGFVTLWVDGQPIFSNNHVWPTGGGAWDNITAGALTQITFDAACLALETRLGPDNLPLGLTADLLVCGPATRSAAEAIVQVQFQAGGGSNRTYRRADLMVLPEMGADPGWAVMATNPVRPIVMQRRMPATFTANEDPNSENAFYRNRYAYKGETRCNVAIIAPWLIQASQG